METIAISPTESAHRLWLPYRPRYVTKIVYSNVTYLRPKSVSLDLVDLKTCFSKLSINESSGPPIKNSIKTSLTPRFAPVTHDSPPAVQSSHQALSKEAAPEPSLHIQRPPQGNGINNSISISPGVLYDDDPPLSSLYQLEEAQDAQISAELDAAQENFDWGEEYENFLANSKFPEASLPDLDARHSSQGYKDRTEEDPISPISIPGQLGSGRKGKNKTPEEYAADASTLGWGGSYNNNTANGNAQRDRSGEDGDPNNRNNNNNSGSGDDSNGGRQGGSGGDGGDESTTANESRNGQALADGSAARSAMTAAEPLNYGISRDPAPCSRRNTWVCVSLLLLRPLTSD
jgi:hypothetical protein